VRGFVSGGVGVLLAHASQGQITTTHQTLGTGQKVANLRAKFAVGRPARAHGVHPEQYPGNVAMARTSLPPIERLQGAQMQQRRAARWSWQGSGDFAMKHTGLCLVLGKPCTRGWVERHHQTASRAVFQFRGQRGTQAVRAIYGHEDQLRTHMRNALAPVNLPSAECPGYRGIVFARGACMEPFGGAHCPEWMRLPRIQVRIIGNTSTPIGPLRPGGADRANWRGKQGCDAGTPKRARDRPGPRYRGRLPQRARARNSQRHRFGSSLFLLPWRFQKPAADSRATSRHQDLRLLPKVVAKTLPGWR
jgi:hypothetical protein